MSSTTAILSSSPALHSLKRQQLVSLCKIHNLKANGKNGEMIERLKLAARDLPPDAPLSIAVRNEESQDEEEEEESPTFSNFHPRPSEQWEVMDSIQEMEESGSQGTLSSLRTIGGSAGEFGTGSTKAPNSVSSSLKAFATSWGIKRPKTNTTTTTITSSSSSSTIATKELMETSVPYSSLPDNNEAPDSPIPGHALRPGVQAPVNARLSMGTSTPNAAKGASTTIRLVNSNRLSVAPSTPKLKAFATTFDLVLGSPTAAGSTTVWPASPGQGDRVYPALPNTFSSLGVPPLPLDDQPMDEDEDEFDMPGGMATPAKALSKHLLSQPADMFSPARPTATAATATPRLSATKADAFIFGSPLPQHNMSNLQFRTAAATVVQSSVAASVLEEMNKRLAESGVPQIGSDLIDRDKLRAAQDAASGGLLAAKAPANDIKSKFDRMHEAEFNKMGSIADHYAARRQKRKSSVLGEGSAAGKRRKSSGLKPSGRTSSGVRVRQSGGRVVSGGVRPKKGGVPGGFGDDDDEEDEEEGNRRSSKRPRVDPEMLAAPQPEKVKRVSIVGVTPENEEEAARLQKERDAIRRKLNANIARRRSSMGRPSIGGHVVPPPKAKAATSRFGFFSSAKSLVQNAWSKGTGKTATKAPPVPAPVPVKAAPPVVVAPPGSKKSGFVPFRPTTTSTTVNATGSTSRLPSNGPPRSSLEADAGRVNSVGSSSRSRSPIPGFAAPTRKRSIIGTAASRNSSVAASGSSKCGSRNSSIAGASSIGTKSGTAAGSRVSSLGTRAGGSEAGSVKRNSSIVGGSGSRPSSRLMMPTASSLAKTQRMSLADTSLAGRLPSVPEPRPQLGNTNIPSPSKTHSRMDAMMSSPMGKGTPVRSPRAVGSIFSKPLLSPSSLPTPSRNPSLSEAANTLVAEALAPKPVAAPPKPKAPLGRKPRISRSRVIAKLASQRAQTTADVSAATPATPVASSSKTRSSMGAGLRAGRGSSGGDVMMSAKKRARQSEHARRKSRAAVGRQSDAMDLS